MEGRVAMRFVEILRDGQLLTRARLCDTFLSESLGYMFRKPSGPLFFRLPYESRILAGIHTFFVLFPLQAIWLDGSLRVVDVKKAKPWGLYWPRRAARYLVETPSQDALPVEVDDTLEVRF
ncbi:MAG: DUF192 domain-containing protein [Candidatus Bathyarchaeia archaeon]